MEQPHITNFERVCRRTRRSCNTRGDHHGDCVKPHIAIGPRKHAHDWPEFGFENPSFFLKFTKCRITKRFAPLERSSGQGPRSGISATNQKPSTVGYTSSDGDAYDWPA